MKLYKNNKKTVKKENISYYAVNSIVVFIVPLLYALICTYLLPEGINQAFVNSLWKRLILPIPPIILLFGLYLYFFGNKHLIYDKYFEPLKKSDFLFVLIPMLPIVRFVIANQEMLNFIDSTSVIFLFLLISFIVCVLVPFFLSFLASKYMIMAVSTAFLFSLFNMASLASIHNWTEEGEIGLQLVVFFVIFVILIMSKFIPRRLVSNIIMLIFAANVGMSIFGASVNDEIAHETETEFMEKEDVTVFPLVSLLGDIDIKYENDIFLIVYEAYAPFETALHYGFDNSRQLDYLKEHGFHIYHGVYSIGTATTASMTRLFNLDVSYPVERKYITGHNAVKSLLHLNNYHTHYVSQSDYMFRNLESVDQVDWDYVFPPLKKMKMLSMEAYLMWSSILKGEFSDEVSLEGLGYDAYLKQKHKVLSGEYPSPIFMYSHSRKPGHGPSTGFIPGEGEKYRKQYIESLHEANSEMKMDVEIILENNPDALVIISGDHGPFLTKDGYGLNRRDNFGKDEVDRYDIQDRYGTFLAIRWPDPSYARRYDIGIFQDVFPAVFSFLYEDDSIFDKTRMERSILNPERILGVRVENGIIVGGQNDGEPLFIHDGE